MRTRLPQPQQLAALGAVLCLSRADAGSLLAGWSRAVRARYGCVLDSDGLRECIRFFDADGACCWRLYLLPDADFLAWEQLVACLPREPAGGDVAQGLTERLWRHLARRLSEPGWRACALRFHVCGGADARAALGASLPVLSAVGQAQLRRILRSEGHEPGASAAKESWARHPAAPAIMKFPSERWVP